METLVAIHNRRSIRQYTSKKVPQELIDKVLQAAMMAPSAGNNQPWHFIVVDDTKILQKIASEMPNVSMARQVNVGILVCGKPEVERFKDYWPQDCAAAM